MEILGMKNMVTEIEEQDVQRDSDCKKTVDAKVVMCVRIRPL